MSIEEYLRTHQLMTREDCVRKSPGTDSTNRFLFGRAVARGQVRSIGVICGTRQRLYASSVGQYSGKVPELGRVARLLSSGGPLGCQSALEAWAGVPIGGVGPVVAYLREKGRAVTWRMRVGSSEIVIVRDFRDRETIQAEDGQLVSPEQALVDSLDDRYSFAAGWDVIPLIKAAGISPKGAMELAMAGPRSLVGRVGYALEASDVDLDAADRKALDRAASDLVGMGFGRRGAIKGRSYDARWHVVPPQGSRGDDEA